MYNCTLYSIIQLNMIIISSCLRHMNRQNFFQNSWIRNFFKFICKFFPGIMSKWLWILSTKYSRVFSKFFPLLYLSVVIWIAMAECTHYTAGTIWLPNHKPNQTKRLPILIPTLFDQERRLYKIPCVMKYSKKLIVKIRTKAVHITKG